MYLNSIRMTSYYLSVVPALPGMLLRRRKTALSYQKREKTGRCPHSCHSPQSYLRHQARKRSQSRHQTVLEKRFAHRHVHSGDTITSSIAAMRGNEGIAVTDSEQTRPTFWPRPVTSNDPTLCQHWVFVMGWQKAGSRITRGSVDSGLLSLILLQ